MSKIQVNEIVNHFDNGAPDCPKGLTVTGVSTFSGNVSIGGTLTYEDVTNIDSVGIITAQSGLHVIAGRVGIGTDDPQQSLYVRNSNSSQYTAIAVDTYAAIGGGVFDAMQNGVRKGVFGVSGWLNSNADDDPMIYTVSGKNLRFYVGGTTERVRINSDGSSLFKGDLSIEGTGDKSISVYCQDTGVQATPRTFINLYGENTANEKKLQAQIASAPGAVASSAGELHFSTNNSSSVITRRMTIDQDGDVGIGTENPIGRLHVFKSGDGQTPVRFQTSNSNSNLRFYNDSVGWSIDSEGDLRFTTSRIGSGQPERMRISAAGKIGINETLPSAMLDVKGTVSAGAGSNEDLQQWNIGSNNVKAEIKYIDASANRGMLFGTTTDHVLAFQTNNAEKMRITTAGRMLLGTDTESAITAAQQFVYTNGITNLLLANNASGGWSCINSQVANSGTYYYHGFLNGNTLIGSIRSENGSTTNFNTSSDYRLKENVVDITDGITRVKQLSPRRFNFIAAPDKTIDGFIAHEAQPVIPEAVHGTKDEVDEDGNAVMQGIDQSKLVPLLTAALQEAIVKIETLEAKVQVLEGS